MKNHTASQRDAAPTETLDGDKGAPQTGRPKRDPDVLWYCREYWSGDSRDGQLTNSDGYHYFEMSGGGTIQKAFEYYETDDGEEKSTELPDLVGLNWFDFFGFEDEELLEPVAEHEFTYVEQLFKK